MAESISMDSVDLTILRVLQNDARTTNRDLAAAAGIAPSTCMDRVARLRAAGVIIGYTVRLDPARLGRGLQAFLAVTLRPHRRPVVAGFVAAVRALPQVRALYHVTGREDFLVHVAVTDVSDLQRVVLDEFTARTEVASVTTNLIYEEWPGPPLLPAESR
ncbi:Lrp/AsnC family transcriptional regulator [Stackebrandtia soli]|uniref:Lrp/AsnC family transcriptional regulator n=1 Tax=Stackebrandtia soli TaxID=1892856 RepID=UPI0039E9D460